MPPFWKPLLVVNGEPLIRRAVDMAMRSGAIRVVVVVAPENALPISQVLDGLPIYIIVQPRPSGPGHALLLGVELCQDDRVLVLMGDNVTTPIDLQKVVKADDYAIGVQQMPASAETERFTRRKVNGTGWVEKTPIGISETEITAWVGPFTASVAGIKRILTSSHAKTDGELAIGPYLDDMSPGAKLVQINSIDVGTPATVSMGES